MYGSLKVTRFSWRWLWSQVRFSVAVAGLLWLLGVGLGATLARLVVIPPDTMYGYRMQTAAVRANEIIKHNLVVIGWLASGALCLGLTTGLLLLWNGAVLGVAISLATETMGAGQVMMRLVPHGILEIPATILAGGAGFRSIQLLIRHLHKQSKEPFWPAILPAGIMLGLAVALTVIAGWVEATITFRVAGRMP